jgi:hypothetical protein
MQPDAKLWPEIARHLDQKKRRRGLIWWCFLGVLAGAGGWAVLLMSPSENKKTRIGTATETTIETTIETATGTTVKQHKEHLQQQPLRSIVPTHGISGHTKVAATSGRMADSVPVTGVVQTAITQPEIIQTNKVQPDVFPQDLLSKDSTRSDSVVSAPAIKKKFPWKWSFNLSAGISGVRNDFFIVNKSAAYLDLAYSSSPIPGGSSGGSGGGIVVPVPVVLRDAAAAEASIQLSRDWDKHWGWYAKVGYNYAQYRLIYNNADYYNRFHLMGITAGLSYTFPLRSGSTIGLNTGLQESLLLGYSATQLPAAANLPNKSMGDFKKSQTAFVFGMEAGFGKSRRFNLGPQFRYQLNQLSSTPGSNQHLVYILLQARWQIIKK